MQLLRVVMAGFLVGSALSLAACGGGGGGGSTPAPSGDTVSPSVSISAPASGATITGTTTVSVSATDDVAVTKVELYLDNVLQSQDTSAPYSFSLDTSSLVKKTYLLTAKAYDAAGNVGQSTTSFKVPIWLTLNTVITGTTAVSTVTLHGLAAAQAFGFDLHVDSLPAGVAVDIGNSSATGGATGALPPSYDSGTGNIRLAGATAFGSGPVLNIRFSGVPGNAVAADFGISLLDVVGQDAQGNVQFIPLN